MSERDSARVWFERYAGALVPAHGDPAELAHTYLRLGDLYEERPSLSDEQRHTAAHALDTVREISRVLRGHPNAAV